MYFTSGMQKTKKKKPRHCHIIDSAESHGIGGKREESLFYKGPNLKKKNLQGPKQKVSYITGGKALLTLQNVYKIKMIFFSILSNLNYNHTYNFKIT